jgi:hypothetical protein
VKLTTRGRTLERTLAPVVDAALQPLLSGLTGAEEQQFLSLLRRSYEAASRVSSELDGPEARPLPRPARGQSAARRPARAPRAAPRPTRSVTTVR